MKSVEIRGKTHAKTPVEVEGTGDVLVTMGKVQGGMTVRGQSLHGGQTTRGTRVLFKKSVRVLKDSS